MRKRILIAVGGTGGHIYPGLALSQKLKEKEPETYIAFIVDKRPLASEVLGEYADPIYKITSAPLPRKRFWQICRFLYKMTKGFFESVVLLRKLKPDVLIAFGAYISVPVVIAASFLGIPVILHEQNYFPGLANKFLTTFADKVAVSFDSSKEYFPANKTVLTGNPVRKEVFEVKREEGLDFFELNEDRVTVLIFGGSLGSQSINLSVLGVLPYLEGLRDSIQFVHICGDKCYQNVINEYSKHGFTARVYKYLKNMEYAYSVADVAVARAGATTIAEITSLGIPTILIPYPEASSQHQMLNARPLCQAGGAICYAEDILSGEGLAVRLIPLIKDANRRRMMAIVSKTLRDRFINASASLADLVLNLKNV